MTDLENWVKLSLGWRKVFELAMKELKKRLEGK